MNLTIITWNTRTKDKLTHTALWDSNAVDVIAIQEPHISTRTSAPACPMLSNYFMIYGSGKAVLYIHKRHGIGKWSPRSGDHWCSVTFHEENLAVYSIYNPNGATTATSPLRHIAAFDPTSRIILAGDFNLHHPMWDHYERTSTYSGDSLDIAQRLRLGLVAPKGECTRFSKDCWNSTIDLI